MARCSGSPAHTSAGLRSSRFDGWVAAVALCALILARAAIAAPPFSQGLLFRLDRPATAPSYIFGTLHSNDPRVLALPEPVRTAFRWALAHRTEVEADQERAIVAWLARDLGELARQAREPGRRHPALAPHLAALSLQLVEGRSALMAHRLFIPLREGRVFVAVGALHLYGDKGMLALLRRQGYRVTRVYRRGSLGFASG
jgi:uncharacterized protein YbaP (TraB family)